ncbi:MAG: hypothetical protein KKB51_10325 [Candidatus Riflebacteria bacterium]|nr:hypothetical protein [Candidatus Riflebacteria bacterium]
MEIKQVTIELNEETIRKLEEKALKAGQKPEFFAADLLKTALSKEIEQSEASQMPGVAMLKGTSEPLLAVPGNASIGVGMIKEAPEPVYKLATPELQPERLRRKAEIEEEMRNLSLVIETAAEADKEKYGMQYAILAAELDALI